MARRGRTRAGRGHCEWLRRIMRTRQKGHEVGVAGAKERNLPDASVVAGCRPFERVSRPVATLFP